MSLGPPAYPTGPTAYLSASSAPAASTLASVLPAVARSLGSDRYATASTLGLPPARHAVVVLLDGLGDGQLRRRAGHAPFLREHLPSALTLDCGFPATTATSMGSFGTGRPPGQHGLVGYEVLDPATDRVFNELSWEGGPEPTSWQPYQTVFQEVAGEGMAVTRIGPAFFDGSGLTTAALRGGSFVAARTLDDRVDAAVTAVRASGRPAGRTAGGALVYLYWADLDTVGHVEGADSDRWVEELERVDRSLARLAAQVPAGTSIHVTADHGMLTVPFSRRVDLADEPSLTAGVRHVGGEPRSPQLYTEPGARERVAEVWQDRLGDDASVATREEVVGAGWFGPVRAGVEERIGDLVVRMRGDAAVVDSVRMRPQVLRLRGLHGSDSAAERSIPLVTVPPRRS